jgi:hypothetical protein
MSTEKKDVALDHPRIWLQNAADGKASGEGRLWCEDNVWPVDENDGEPTEYVRADIVDDLVAALKAARVVVAFSDRRSSVNVLKTIDAALSSYRKQGE